MAAKKEKKPYELVIVESPAKAKTIGKILGSKYRVIASQGHVRDLPKSRLAVDVEGGFEPEYINIRGKAPLLKEIKKEAKNAKKVFLATDPDREGEAISWHIGNIIEDKDAKRIEFNEITKSAIQEAIKHPRDINTGKVNAQQARRVLDRLVGYKISPILWEKVKKGLSAGRVQSVAMRMICELEEQIDNFISEEYWSLDAKLMPKGKKKTFTAHYHGEGNKKVDLKTKEQVDKIISELKDFVVKEVKKGNLKKHAAAPFSTSTMQQDASRKLGFSTKKTMMVAQQLYEGVEIKKKGHVGLVSYIRTDSVRISKEAQSDALAFIEANFGNDYVPQKPNIYKGRKGAQDAHEAIRPTDIKITPESIKDSLNKDQLKLYTLIYNRFLSSQMAEARYSTINTTILSGNHVFKAGGQNLIFDGYLIVYNEADKEKKKETIPELNEGDMLDLNKVVPEQHFTQPPARYTEASLVRALEEKGIGRPSTYAPTISTIFERGYITRKEKSIQPTELGKIVTKLIVDNFSDIVNIEFTADMEDDLDEIESGEKEWKKVIGDFYVTFKKLLEDAEVAIEKIKIADEVSDVPCDKCGAMMVYKVGKYGKFLACPNYPECKNTKPIMVTIDVPCPKCGGKVLKLKTKRGKPFYGCEKYPKCDFTSWYLPTDKKCPTCGKYMVEKNVKGGTQIICSDPDCKTSLPKENKK